MRLKIFSAVIGSLIGLSFFSTGCGLTVNIAFATPSITPVVATSVPPGIIVPTLTPFPTIAPATSTIVPIAPTGPTATATIQASPTLAPTASPTLPTNTPTSTSTPTQTPTQTPLPPPPPPTQVVLPQLSVFDKDGNNMEGRVFGTPLGKTFISFRAMVCSPNCNSKPDGNGVTSVQFDFYKGTTQSRSSLSGKKPVFTQKENNHPYCSFGGDNPCPNWVFAEHGNKWPNGTPIEDGPYTLLINANGNGQNNGLWRSVINFSIQR